MISYFGFGFGENTKEKRNEEKEKIRQIQKLMEERLKAKLDG